MSTVQIYDRAMCCSTGVCGPQVDPTLPKFAADLDWLKAQGHDVQRFNLAQDAIEFATAALMKKMLHRPSVALRKAGEAEDHELITSARKLFGLDDE